MLLLAGGLNPLLKLLFSAVTPALSRRPSGCGGGVCTGCGVFPGRGASPVEGTGMPSGHAQLFAAALGFVAAKKGGVKALPWLIPLLIVSVQRKLSRCHTWLQVCLGGVIGFAIGCGAGRLLNVSLLTVSKFVSKKEM